MYYAQTAKVTHDITASAAHGVRYNTPGSYMVTSLCGCGREVWTTNINRDELVLNFKLLFFDEIDLRPTLCVCVCVCAQSIIFDEVDLTDASVAESSTKNVNNSFTVSKSFNLLLNRLSDG